MLILKRPPRRSALQAGKVQKSGQRQALARFTSSYAVWFTPTPSSSPRTHRLDVRLAAKSSGKVTDGKRSAIY
jgi:hypothetical protein